MANIITGTGDDDSLSGTLADDFIDGLGGKDFIVGLAGSDEIYGRDGDDTLYGGSQNDFWAVVYFQDWIDDVSDTLVGGAGDDFLDGGVGNDILMGGSGNDTYYVLGSPDRLYETATTSPADTADEGGIDTIISFQSIDLEAYANLQFFENVTLVNGDRLRVLSLSGNALANTLIGANGGFHTLSGRGGDDTLVGALGADWLDGGTGNDTLDGGYGVDTASYASATSAVTVSTVLAGPQDTGGAGIDTLIGIENLEGSAFADTLTGNGVLEGRAGDDLYYIASIYADVRESSGGGSDTIYTKISYTLRPGQEIETLQANLSDGLTLTGNEFDNTVIGAGGPNKLNGGGGDDTLSSGSGADRLDGGTGADVMSGGSGDDTYYVDNFFDQVKEALAGGSDTVFAGVSFTLMAGQEVEVLRANSGAGLTLVGNQFTKTLIGSTGADALTGGAGDNSLNGGTGVDTMSGGSGNDAYYVDNGADQVIEAAGGGSDTVYASASYTLGAGQEVESLRGTGSAALSLTGNEFANILVGVSGNDSLNGGAGNDVLNGGIGADTMTGGAGNDTFYVDNAADQVFEAAGGGTDTVFTTANLALAKDQEVEYLRVSGSAGLTLTGSDFDNILFGGIGNDTLNGGAGHDQLSGDAGNDVLNGGSGDDVMIGGAGDDTYYVDSVGDRVYETVTTSPTDTASAGGIDRVYSSVSFDLDAYNGVRFVQDLILTGTANTNGTGNAAANTVTGNDGNNVLEGGLGKDTVSYATASAGVTVSLAVAGPQVTGGAGTDLPSGFESLTGSAFADTLTGDGGDNDIDGGGGDDILNAGAGNDSLKGGTGADVMSGGSGNDIYYVDSSNDEVIEAIGGGSDTVFASVSYALIAGLEVEVLRADSAAGLTLGGNELANTLIGSTGADTLDGGGGNDSLTGGAGADKMSGGSGNDTYYVDNSGDQVAEAAGDGTDTVYASVAYVLAAGAEIETLRAYVATGVALTGNELANSLIGLAGNDTLNGGAGNDSLNGAAGADVMSGGSGNDTYYVDNAGDQLAEAIGAGTDTVHASVNYVLAAGREIETLRVYGTTTGLTLTGNEFANTVIGGAGNDRLDGGAGADTLAGGAGADIYLVDNAGDKVTEAAGQGTDNVYASASWAMAAGQEIEYVRVSGSAGLTLTGNELTNYLIGGTGNDALNGGGGNDSLNGGTGADAMTGGTGNDTYYVDNAGDQVTEAAGQGTGDSVYASVNWAMTAGQEIESLRAYVSTGLALVGNELANSLIGGAGNDTLNGGAGNDLLVGGTGNDTLVFGLASGRDKVGDFAPGTDKIDLTAYDFASFAEVMTLAADVGANTVISLDASDTVTLSGVHTAQLHSGDFLL